MTVLSRAGSTPKSKKSTWLARCECGTTKVVVGHELTSGHIVSCGCYRTRMFTEGRERLHSRAKKHGLSGTPAYQSWRDMIRRCSDMSHEAWGYYGGRGIQVCERWQSFEMFHADMGPRPSVAHTLDRIDVNGHYEPGNCRWATPVEQARNRQTPCDGLTQLKKGELIALARAQRAALQSERAERDRLRAALKRAAGHFGSLIELDLLPSSGYDDGARACIAEIDAALAGTACPECGATPHKMSCGTRGARAGGDP